MRDATDKQLANGLWVEKPDQFITQSKEFNNDYQTYFCQVATDMLLQKHSPSHIHTICKKIVNTLPLEWQYSGIAYQLYSLLSTLLLMYNVSLIVLHHSTTLTGGRGYCSELQFNFFYSISTYFLRSGPVDVMSTDFVLKLFMTTKD